MDVTIFSAAGCGKCVATKYGLKKRGIEVHEVRVDQVPGAADNLRNAGLAQLPVVMAFRSEEDEVPDIWADFHPDYLDALLDPALEIPDHLFAL